MKTVFGRDGRPYLAFTWDGTDDNFRGIRHTLALQGYQLGHGMGETLNLTWVSQRKEYKKKILRPHEWLIVSPLGLGKEPRIYQTHEFERNFGGEF